MIKRVTMKDVAELAGVSTTTVSHVINKTRHVDESTRESVEFAMKELRYQPNYVARSLRSGETKTIGLIVPDASNLFFAEIARRIEDLGYQEGYSVILGNSDNDPDKQTNYINTLLAKQVDGVIFISSGGEAEDLELLSANNIPIVVADRDVPLSLADVVLLDNEKAGYEATRYLINLGHKCIACITGPSELSPSMSRVEGYKKALREVNIPYFEELIAVGDFRIKGGEIAMGSLLQQSCKPTAVFALNDMMAIGAMTAIRKAGLRIPDDISVIGFDDIELASAVTPTITTMAQPLDELSKNAIDLLIEQIRGENREGNSRIILSAHLIERESTAAREENDG
jgi:LacI family transcriptional regulator